MRPLLWMPALAGCLWISPADHATRLDGDGDGALGDVDCDDADPRRAPSFDETPCDGADNDCDEATPDGPALLERTGSTYVTVQQALDAATAGDRVVVCDGTHYDHVVVATPGVTLAGSGATILDGAGADGAVLTVAAADVTLMDLAVVGGTGTVHSPTGAATGRYGGGVDAMDAGGRVTLVRVKVSGSAADYGAGVAGVDLTFDRCELSGNDAAGAGGGAWIGRSGALTATQVLRNDAAAGGGLAVGPGAVVTLDDTSRVSENAAGRGGGATVGEDGTLTGGVYDLNQASIWGGGVDLDEGTLARAEVRENTAPRGGGVFGAGALDRVEIAQNAADVGGGVEVDGVLAVVLGLISSNTATEAGGGVMVGLGSRFTVVDDPAEIDVPRLLANRADSGWGGAVAVLGGEVVLERADLADNHAMYGGAVAVRDTTPCTSACEARFDGTVFGANVAELDGGAVWSDRPIDVDACTLTGNRADDGGGGAMYLEAGAGIDDSTFADNTSGSDGGGVLVVGGVVTLEETALTGNVATGRGAAVMVRPVAPDTAHLDVITGDLRSNVAVSSAAIALAATGATLGIQGALWFENVDFDVEVGGTGCHVTGEISAFDCGTELGGVCDPPTACVP